MEWPFKIDFFYRKFDQAMQVITEHGGKYSLVSVARLYLDHLLAQQKYDEAAKLCQTTFGNDKVLWVRLWHNKKNV